MLTLSSRYDVLTKPDHLCYFDDLNGLALDLRNNTVNAKYCSLLMVAKAHFEFVHHWHFKPDLPRKLVSSGPVWSLL